MQDRVVTPADGTHVLQTWTPHSFFPIPDVEEDTVMMIWAHPDGIPEAMDVIFFRNILLYLSDMSENKASFDPFQIMLMQ